MDLKQLKKKKKRILHWDPNFSYNIFGNVCRLVILLKTYCVFNCIDKSKGSMDCFVFEKPQLKTMELLECAVPETISIAVTGGRLIRRPRKLAVKKNITSCSRRLSYPQKSCRRFANGFHEQFMDVVKFHAARILET